MTATGRPCARPWPITTPSAAPAMSSRAGLAMRPISTNEPGSRNASTPSRAVSRPWAWRFAAASGRAASSAAARAARTASSGEGGASAPASPLRLDDILAVTRSRLRRVAAAVADHLLTVLDDLIGQAPGQLLEMVELELEGADTLRQRPQLDHEVLDLRLRHVRVHFVPALPARLGIEAQDLPAPPADEALDVRGEAGRRRDRDLVDRFQQDR